MYDKARDAMSRGADEAQRYVREATGSTPGTPSTAPGSSSFGSSSYSSPSDVRGSTSDFSRGSGSTGGSNRS
jgi:hypothetical protein